MKRGYMMLAAGLCLAGAMSAQGAPERLKVLSIGNSYSVAMARAIPPVAKAMGVEIDIATMFIGGQSLEGHCQCMTNETAKPYLVCWSYDGVPSNEKAPFVPLLVDTEVVRRNGTRMEKHANIIEMLKSDRWDVVTIQQASAKSWDPATYRPYGDELLAVIRRHAPQAKVCVQETWSYTRFDRRLAEWGFDREEMFRRLHRAYGDFASERGLDLIPTGTAVQVFRRLLPVTPTENSLGGDVTGALTFERNGDGTWKATGDPHHMNSDGTYMQACVWVAKLFGVDVTDCPYVAEGVDPKRAALMRKCAMKAVLGRRLEARLSAVAIEGGVAKTGNVTARAELEKHLALVAGGEFRPTQGDAELTIVLGAKPEGEDEPAAHTAYARLVGRRLHLWGDDRRMQATLFAVYGFLENVLGVVWPMPGDENIVAPAADRVRIPEGWSWSYRPPLKCGMMRGGNPKGGDADRCAELAPKALRRTPEEIDKAAKDIAVWKLRQKLFVRESMPFGHAFLEWNDRYRDTHPEYLALQANGERGTAKKGTRDAHFMKLCVSNDEVVDVIVEKYVKAGKPKYFNVCPNDGYSFCHCDRCKALDCPVNEAERELRMSQAVNLTDRYVNFWNRIARKLVALRPDVMLDTYAYSVYRDPPRRERIEFPDNMCFGMVPSQEDDNLKQIRAWKAKGMKHFKLRPNYLCYTGWIPRGYERFFLENFKMNYREGMIGTDYDGSPRGEVTAFECYAIARAHQDPAISFEKIEREFLSQFGNAAPAMKRYYDRVRERNEKALYARQRYNGGDKEAVLDDSLLVGTVVAANPPEELEKDAAVLEEALKTPGLSPDELRRVRAVAALPRHAILTREFKLSFDSEKTGEMKPDFVEKGLKLLDYRINVMRPVITPVNWGPTFRLYPFEVKYWRQKPLKKELNKKYPEMGYAG